MNADDLGRSRTDGANQIADADQRKRHALAVMRMQLAVQRRRIHQHNRAQQVGRNVVAEVDNRRAGRRQRPRAGGLVGTRRQRVIGRIGEPVLVNRQVGRRHQARNRIRPQIDRHRRRRRVAVLVGDRVLERIEPFLARRRRVGEGAVAVIDRRALGGRRRHRNPGRRVDAIGAEQIVGQRGA